MKTLPIAQSCTKSTALIALLVGVVFASCGGGESKTVVDAAEVDAAEVDGSTVDGSTLDGSTVDRSIVDRSIVDGSTVDRSTVDRLTVDRSIVDGSTVDRSTVDSRLVDGSTVDGRSVDASTFICNESVMPQPNIGLVQPIGASGCAGGMILVGTFCIDQYEAALVDNTTGQPWSPYFSPGSRAMRAVSIKGQVPQGYISGAQAKQACLNAGKRLCTETEWVRACRGPTSTQYPTGTKFPYGPARIDGLCNDARSRHPAVELFGRVTNLDSPCINELPNGLDKAGENIGCVTRDSPGAYDMMGNLHEWVDDPAGTFRGGFYVDTKINGDGCEYRTGAHNFTYSDYSTGFRCCATPTP